MENSKREARQARLTESATSPWLSGSMKASLMLDYADGDLPSPVTAARYLGDLSEELGDVVSLSGGTIGDRLPPDFVRNAAREAVDKYPHYPGVKGHRDLRQAISRKLERENAMVADPDDEVLITIGAQQVIDSTFRILVGAGDEVLLFDPEYASTEPAIRMAGGRVVPVPLALEKGEWRFDFEALARRATRKSKLLVMSNGGNPSGIVYSREELEQIADLARRLDLWVFSDEEYEKTLLDGTTHYSIASLPGMKERTVTAFSFSKAYGMTAYRIGYAVGPAKVIDHMHSILRFSLQACSAVGQRRGPCRAHRRHGAMAPRQHRQPGAQARLPRRPAQPDPGDPLQHAEGLLLHLPRRAGAGAAHLPAGGAPPAARPRRRRARVRVRPEGRGSHPRELLLQPGADHRRHESAGAGARRAAGPAAGLRRVECDSPRRSAVSERRRGPRSPGGSTWRSGPGGAIRCPVGLVNGAEDGPRLSITAGVHGTEYVAQEAAIRFFRELDPKTVRGAVGFIFIVNVPGWEAAETFANPMDGQNLNRIFPGNTNGTVSFVIAHRVVELLSNWGKWHIDMHGGDASEWLNPFAIFHRTGKPEVDSASEQMARLWDTEVVWSMTHQSGYPGTLVGTLSDRGIPSIVAESGYLSTYNEPEIAVHVKGARNVMRAFGLLDGKPEHTRSRDPLMMTENWVAYATRGGVFHPQVKPGDRVRGRPGDRGDQGCLRRDRSRRSRRRRPGSCASSIRAGW